MLIQKFFNGFQCVWPGVLNWKSVAVNHHNRGNTIYPRIIRIIVGNVVGCIII